MDDSVANAVMDIVKNKQHLCYEDKEKQAVRIPLIALCSATGKTSEELIEECSSWSEEEWFDFRVSVVSSGLSILKLGSELVFYLVSPTRAHAGVHARTGILLYKNMIPRRGILCSNEGLRSNPECYRIEYTCEPVPPTDQLRTANEGVRNPPKKRPQNLSPGRVRKVGRGNSNTNWNSPTDFSEAVRKKSCSYFGLDPTDPPEKGNDVIYKSEFHRAARSTEQWLEEHGLDPHEYLSWADDWLWISLITSEVTYGVHGIHFVVSTKKGLKNAPRNPKKKNRAYWRQRAKLPEPGPKKFLEYTNRIISYQRDEPELYSCLMSLYENPTFEDRQKYGYPNALTNPVQQIRMTLKRSPEYLVRVVLKYLDFGARNVWDISRVISRMYVREVNNRGWESEIKLPDEVKRVLTTQVYIRQGFMEGEIDHEFDEFFQDETSPTLKEAYQ